MMVCMFYLGLITQLSLILSILNSTTHCRSLEREASLIRPRVALVCGYKWSYLEGSWNCQFNETVVIILSQSLSVPNSYSSISGGHDVGSNALTSLGCASAAAERQGDAFCFSFKCAKAHPTPNLPGSTGHCLFAKHSAQPIANTQQMNECASLLFS